jgi:N-acetylmuramic acid 6-phosphate (MurNAc-6-P) etherase
VKVAIVMEKLGVDLPEAERRLHEVEGVVSRVVGDLL